MSLSGELKRVLAELPHFRVRTRDDFHVAEKMLTLLIRNLDVLSAEQKLMAKAFKTQVERYRKMWKEPPGGSKD